MTVALIGSHGTGKTTVFDLVKLFRRDIAFFAEGARYQCKAFGYKDPYEISRKFGSAAFELMNLNSWSVIDPGQNTLLKPGRLALTDRSAVDNWAYQLVLRNPKVDAALEPFVFRIAQHYAKLIDLFIYFPTGVIPLVGDEMRPDDLKFQQDVDDAVWRAIDQLGIDERRIHHLNSVRTEDRVREVLSILPPA